MEYGAKVEAGHYEAFKIMLQLQHAARAGCCGKGRGVPMYRVSTHCNAKLHQPSLLHAAVHHRSMDVEQFAVRNMKRHQRNTHA